MCNRRSSCFAVASSTRFSGLSQGRNTLGDGGESLAKSVVELRRTSLYSVALGNQVPETSDKAAPESVE